MSFTAKDVASLRGMTGAGMMDCKKALTEANGNIDEAVSLLRQKGLSKAAKKAGNIAAEGLIGCAIAGDKKSAAIIEVNSQTDFVARNEEFIKLVDDVANVALTNKTKTLEELLKVQLEGKALADLLTEKTATIGEKIDLRRVEFYETDGVIGNYVHPVGSKVGVIVELSSADAQEKAIDLAMHIAASSPAPEFTNRDEIPAEEIEKEKQIEMGKEDLAGKPDEIKEKIVKGRVDKLLAARVLVEQPFIKDPNQKVSEYLGDVNVAKFVRFNLGEGIEKKEDNFAEEVAAMSSGNA